MEKMLTFKSGEYRLNGVLHLPDNQTGHSRCVVMFHGFTGNKVESHFLFTKAARALQKRGLAVFRFDFMGSGDSEGNFEEMTLDTEIDDAKNAVDFILSQEKISQEKLGVIGFSMGAIAASFIAGYREDVKAVSLWAPLALPELLAGKLVVGKAEREIKEKGKAYIPGLGHFIGKKFIESMHRIKPIGYLEKYRGGVSIFQARDDASLPLEHAFLYFDALHRNGVSPAIRIFDAGGHTFNTEFSEKTLIRENTDFFVDMLKIS